MPDIISQIFNEVIAIFGIDEQDADNKGLWKKFEDALGEILCEHIKRYGEHAKLKEYEWMYKDLCK